MLICGIKLTHDGAIALVEDGVLVHCIEMEKLANHRRFSSIEDTSTIAELVRLAGAEPEAVDAYAVDGWGGYDQGALAIQPRLQIGSHANRLSARDGSSTIELEVAQYEERALSDDVLSGQQFTGLRIEGRTHQYLSFLHAAGHVMGAYATSPYAQRGESSYVLVWDGGMYPRLYFFDARTGCIENLGPLFLLVGNIYTIFSQHFAVFKVDGGFAKDELSVAGKVMAYIAKGSAREELIPLFDDLYRNHYDHPMGFANIFARRVRELVCGKHSDEDILASFHVFLERLLISKLAKKVTRSQRGARHLCMAGGCALNIKWNAAIRASQIFDDVHVPPFPNDSGSAIGAACCAMRQLSGCSRLQWDVYKGPKIVANAPAAGWDQRPCSLAELSAVLYHSPEPIIVLNGRAELGPRALGNRSILAPATHAAMHAELNRIKGRESYRPVAPICLEHRAREIFEPGIADPWMLFEHRVRPEWAARVPAIRHIDGSARLQTVNHRQNPVLAELLERYDALSGIPLLCNTSANLEGCGFFPDVHSATAWGRVRRVWCEGVLYERSGSQLSPF